MTQSVKPNNGIVMPALGLGVFQSAPHETATAVEAVVRTGYRHIDTAAAYGNEAEVGVGLRRSGAARSDIFVETKVGVSDYGHRETLAACALSARKLGVQQIDLLILHQPARECSTERWTQSRHWRSSRTKGKVRAIGVSNFMPHHLADLLERTDLVPAGIKSSSLHTSRSPRCSERTRSTRY